VSNLANRTIFFKISNLFYGGKEIVTSVCTSLVGTETDRESERERERERDKV
jgi:hypothetical protein